jgi:hypothetical protein
VVRSGAGRMGGPVRVHVGTRGGGNGGFTWNLGAVRLDGGEKGGGGGGGIAATAPPPPTAMTLTPGQAMGFGGGGGGVESVLTIRAKKSDIDAFAKGKANLDEFRKKATVLIY